MASESYILRSFKHEDAPVVISWVRDEQELFQLAPGTVAPLTVDKVIDWTREKGNAFILQATGEPVLYGYGEINAVKNDPGHVWLGHLLVDPNKRGNGLGRELTHALVERAKNAFNAHKVTLVVFPENIAAVTCYRNCGFVSRKSEYHTFGKRGRYQLLRMDLKIR